MDFEFDPAKSAANKAKHGIDFEEAKRLWLDDNRLDFPGSFDDEARSLIIGMLDGKYWTAVITYRGAKIRIISVRRARELERQCYEG